MALLLATPALGHAQHIDFNCSGQMRIIKQFKNSDLGERDLFPFTEKVAVDVGAKTAEIGIAKFQNVKVTDDRIEGKSGTFGIGQPSDSFEINLTNGGYHRMTRVPSGDYDVFSETATDGTSCTKSEPTEKPR